MNLSIDQAIVKMNKAAQANIRRLEKVRNLYNNDKAGAHYKHKAMEYRQIARMLEDYKQSKEPQIPYMESDGYIGGYPVWDYYCPNCSHAFEEEEPTFCPDCGTMINWDTTTWIGDEEDD